MDQVDQGIDKNVSRPLSERVCDWACVCFAVWTVCCNLVVFLGGSFVQLLTIAAVAALVLAAAVAVKVRRLGAAPARPELRHNPAGELPWQATGRRVAALVLGPACGLAYLWHRDVVVLWWSTVVVLGALALPEVVSAAQRPQPAARGRALEVGLWTVALLCVAVTLAAHRPAADDTFYVNLAVEAVDAPHGPLLRYDGMHGIQGLPLHMPAYMVHSYELWNAALAFLLPVPVIVCFHVISAVLAALLVPLALARLLRLIVPGYWLWATAVVVALLILVGDTPRWYGCFAFVRMWMGKAVFVSVLVPLIFAYGLQMGRAPNLRRALLLACAVIAAVGCSCTALWAAPCAAMAAVAAAVQPSRAGLKTLLVAAAAVSYPVLVGLVVRADTVRVLSAWRDWQPASFVEEAVTKVLGNGTLLGLSFAALAAAWACCPEPLARRFAAVVPLLVLVTLLNPYSAGLVTRQLTGPFLWRAMWCLPVPVILALVAMLPVHASAGGRYRLAGFVACLGLVAAFVLLVPTWTSLSPENRVRLAWPGLKVPQPEYGWAEELNRRVPPGSAVVAPREVSMWVPTFRNHAYPMEVRSYLGVQEHLLPPGELVRRRIMNRVADGSGRGMKEEFKSGLERFGVYGVCLRVRDQQDERGRWLADAGFRRVAGDDVYELWVRHAGRATTRGRGM